MKWIAREHVKVDQVVFNMGKGRKHENDNIDDFLVFGVCNGFC